MRLSSKPEEQYSPEQCEAWLVNNRLFPHLFNPYFEQKDMRAKMRSIVNSAIKEQGMKISQPFVLRDLKLVQMPIKRVRNETVSTKRDGKSLTS